MTSASAFSCCVTFAIASRCSSTKLGRGNRKASSVTIGTYFAFSFAAAIRALRNFTLWNIPAEHKINTKVTVAGNSLSAGWNTGIFVGVLTSNGRSMWVRTKAHALDSTAEPSAKMAVSATAAPSLGGPVEAEGVGRWPADVTARRYLPRCFIDASVTKSGTITLCCFMIHLMASWTSASAILEICICPRGTVRNQMPEEPFCHGCPYQCHGYTCGRFGYQCQ
mmetsp:Transcript_154384/g.493739  ORF Transcript_154384/g.493739 Transcript_154384/m.493739 type:complete len:223 (-) Transcript_154384:45-713(-)